VLFKPRLVARNFITGQNEREENTQDTIVTKNAACASYEINYVTLVAIWDGWQRRSGIILQCVINIILSLIYCVFVPLCVCMYVCGLHEECMFLCLCVYGTDDVCLCRVYIKKMQNTVLYATLLLVKMKEKKLLKIQSLPKVLRVSYKSNYVTYTFSLSPKLYMY
jgi:hypothetical protein